MATDTAAWLSARGTFYRVELPDGARAGLYMIEGLNDATTRVSGAPILITGISESKSDLTSQMSCLNNVKVYYSFGQNFGAVQIQGEMLLGALGKVDLDGLNQLEAFFKAYRVSNRLRPIIVSIGNTSFYIYLTGFKASAVDPEFHILPFVFEGTLLDLQNEFGDLVNPSSVVLTGNLLDSKSALEKALSVRNPEPPQFDTPATAEPPKTQPQFSKDNGGGTDNPTAAATRNFINKQAVKQGGKQEFTDRTNTMSDRYNEIMTERRLIGNTSSLEALREFDKAHIDEVTALRPQVLGYQYQMTPEERHKMLFETPRPVSPINADKSTISAPR